MNIIILGAGQVGGTLAENLAGEDNNITIVDEDADRLRDLQARLDVRAIQGAGSSPSVLREAGADDAEMLIAVTSSDEANMVACQVAYTLFQIPTKIARIRASSYHAHPELFQNHAMPVDVLISPEQLVTDYVRQLIEYPGSLQVLDFANGSLKLVAVKPYYGGLLVGKTLSELKNYLPDVQVRIAAIYRGNRSIELTGSTVIEIGDEVFFIAASNDIREMMGALRRVDNQHRRIVIAGGGNIGFRLASSLEHKYQVKIIEHNERQSLMLAEKLAKTTVLLGDASDKDLLLDENIEHADVFCAMTDDDEINIMSCLQAKQLGARRVMALIKRTAYVDLIEGSEIDIAISPQLATIGSILSHIRRGDIVKVHSLRRGAAEAIEAVAHGDEKTSKVVGRAIEAIKLPPDTTIGAIVREGQVVIPHHSTVIESEDHVVLFLGDKKRIHQVERLFQVDLAFFT